MAIYRKIFRQGNSLALTLPQWMIDQQGVKCGDYFQVESFPDQMITLTGKSADKVAHNADLAGHQGRLGGVTGAGAGGDNVEKKRKV